jgi:hypothetical protein
VVSDEAESHSQRFSRRGSLFTCRFQSLCTRLEAVKGAAIPAATRFEYHLVYIRRRPLRTAVTFDAIEGEHRAGFENRSGERHDVFYS